MPTAEQKEALITSAVKVNETYAAYVEALTENQVTEMIAMDWPVVDILECATEARRRVGQPHRDEDELLTIFESLTPNIRQRYAEERKAQLDELNEKFDEVLTEHVFGEWPKSIETGAWDAVPNGL